MGFEKSFQHGLQGCTQFPAERPAEAPAAETGDGDDGGYFLRRGHRIDVLKDRQQSALIEFERVEEGGVFECGQVASHQSLRQVFSSLGIAIPQGLLVVRCSDAGFFGDEDRMTHDVNSELRIGANCGV